MHSFYKGLVAIVVMVLAIPFQGHAQIKNIARDTVHVYGNCGMCEATIEKGAFKKGVAEADWDRATKMAVISYDSTKTNVKEVLKRIADVGYDNDMFTAPDDAYSKLHACCQYERKPR